MSYVSCVMTSALFIALVACMAQIVLFLHTGIWLLPESWMAPLGVIRF